VLREIGESKTADANRAAKALRKSRAEYLVIRREIRSVASKTKWPQQVVQVADFSEIGDWLKSDQKSLCVLPLRRLFDELSKQV
jgi:hypothetical protein